ncbi:MAG TPA: CPCC family cysteine-rich protein [Candidatus Acidoferrales bacterium]|nr:CPCC family cysteine-rich protein [Candidatus Acidoferrales bacterium]
MTFDREQFEARRRIFEDAGRDTCPACGYPTIAERCAYEICSLCAWEDDGQDDNPHRPEGYHDYFAPDDVAGGPNHDYSLTEARENFAQNFTSYRPADIDFENERATTNIKREIAKAYDRAVRGLTDVDQAEEEAQYFYARLYGINE